MTLLVALVLALLGALGTVWVVLIRREQERDTAILAEQMASLTDQVASLRTSVDNIRVELSAMRKVTEASRAELTEFVQGPPSVRRPTWGGS